MDLFIDGRSAAVTRVVGPVMDFACKFPFSGKFRLNGPSPPEPPRNLLAVHVESFSATSLLPGP